MMTMNQAIEQIISGYNKPEMLSHWLAARVGCSRSTANRWLRQQPAPRVRKGFQVEVLKAAEKLHIRPRIRRACLLHR